MHSSEELHSFDLCSESTKGFKSSTYHQGFQIHVCMYLVTPPNSHNSTQEVQVHISTCRAVQPEFRRLYCSVTWPVNVWINWKIVDQLAGWS